MFVVVSWVSFLIKPEVVPGRMALLVTLFLVLINIFNSVRYVCSQRNALEYFQKYIDFRETSLLKTLNDYF